MTVDREDQEIRAPTTTPAHSGTGALVCRAGALLGSGLDAEGLGFDLRNRELAQTKGNICSPKKPLKIGHGP
jgi:hypothetical protein